MVKNSHLHQKRPNHLTRRNGLDVKSLHVFEMNKKYINFYRIDSVDAILFFSSFWSLLNNGFFYIVLCILFSLIIQREVMYWKSEMVWCVFA